MKIGNIKAVFFDFGGVVTKRCTSPPLEKVVVKYLKRLGIKVPDSIYRAIKKSFSTGIRLSLSTLIEIRIEEYFKQALRTLNLYPQRSLINDFVRFFYNEITCEIRVEVYDIIRSIKRMHILTGIISNSFSNFPRFFLKKKKLASMFDVIVLSRDIQRRKPHPDIFMYAVRKLGVNPNESLFVGDIYEVDVFGAKSVGMIAVLMITPEAWSEWKELVKKYTPKPSVLPKPDYVIHALNEVLEIIEEIRSPSSRL